MSLRLGGLRSGRGGALPQDKQKRCHGLRGGAPGVEAPCLSVQCQTEQQEGAQKRARRQALACVDGNMHFDQAGAEIQ